MMMGPLTGPLVGPALGALMSVLLSVVSVGDESGSSLTLTLTVDGAGPLSKFSVSSV